MRRFYGALNTAPSLPAVTAIDHAAAAVGFQTKRMAARRTAEQSLRRRATVAGVSTLQQLGTKVRNLTSELRQRSSEAHRGQREAESRDKELQEEKQAGAEEVALLHREVSRLASALKTAQEENANWVVRLQSLSADFGVPVEQSADFSPRLDQRKNRNVPR